MSSRIKRYLFIVLMSFITTAVFSGLAPASEFSAEIIVKGGRMSGQGKVWVKGHKMRQEFGEQFGKMITIMDLDKGINWVIMPQTKTYITSEVKTKGKSFRPENFTEMQQGQMKAQIKLVGTEKVNGYKCDKYLITFENKKMGTMTQWFAKKLNYPIKMVNKSEAMGDMETELKNIKIGGVNDSLFKIPAGYKEMTLQIPQIPVEK